MTSTPTFATLNIIVDGRVATLEFARPNNLNALSRQCLSEVITASTWLGQQSQVRVVIVRGQGRAFCSGFDLGDFAQVDPDISLRESGDLGIPLAWGGIPRLVREIGPAATKEMIGTMCSIFDTDSLVVATHDPESRAAGAAYIASRKRR